MPNVTVNDRTSGPDDSLIRKTELVISGVLTVDIYSCGVCGRAGARRSVLPARRPSCAVRARCGASAGNRRTGPGWGLRPGGRGECRSAVSPVRRAGGSGLRFPAAEMTKPVDTRPGWPQVQPELAALGVLGLQRCPESTRFHISAERNSRLDWPQLTRRPSA